jgi:hypothetical protein
LPPGASVSSADGTINRCRHLFFLRNTRWIKRLQRRWMKHTPGILIEAMCRNDHLR